MKVEKIDHVAILVADLEKAGKLFSEVFGIKFTPAKEVKELDIKNMLSPEGIELVAPLSKDGPMARTLERRGEGLTLLSLKVSDLPKATAEMKAKGIRQIGAVGTHASIFHPKDTFGVTIELVNH